MDVSKEYIAQCDCPKIQDLWKTEIGDYHTYILDDSYGIKIISYGDGKFRNDRIWLPRQDQLQEMIKIDPIPMILRFNIWFDDMWKDSGHDLIALEKSMEQLWLAFIMKEKFNLTWKDGKWKT